MISFGDTKKAPKKPRVRCERAITPHRAGIGGKPADRLFFFSRLTTFFLYWNKRKSNNDWMQQQRQEMLQETDCTFPLILPFDRWKWEISFHRRKVFSVRIRSSLRSGEARNLVSIFDMCLPFKKTNVRLCCGWKKKMIDHVLRPWASRSIRTLYPSSDRIAASSASSISNETKVFANSPL